MAAQEEEEEAQVTLVIRGLTGQEVAVVTLLFSQSVLDVKKAISKAKELPVGKQRLLAGTAVLKNQTRLGEVLPHAETVELTLVLTDKWPDEVAEDWHRLRKAPEQLRNDPELVTQALAASKGEALKYAGGAARADREIVLEAMRHDVSTLRFADSTLREDVSFLLAASPLLATSPTHLLYRADVHKWWGWQRLPELCCDRTFVLAMARVTGCAALKAATQPLRGDKEVVLAAVRSSGNALEFAAQGLRGDREVVQEAIRSMPEAIQYASEALKADRQLAMLAVEQPVRFQGTCVLACLDPALRGDWTLVSQALRQCNLNFEHASPELKCDVDMIYVALEAARTQGLWLDPNWDAFLVPAVLEMLEADWRKFEFLPMELQQRREVAMAALKSRGGVPARRMTRMTLSSMVEKLLEP